MVRVLLIDDDAADLRCKRRILEHAGFRADCAIGGEQAIGMLQAGAYDAVLIDVMMPEVNGLTLAHDVLAKFPAVRVVLTSGFVLSRSQLDRMELGNLAFVSKPATEAQLTDALLH